MTLTELIIDDDVDDKIDQNEEMLFFGALMLQNLRPRVRACRGRGTEEALASWGLCFLDANISTLDTGASLEPTR
jgi:hypothetical protein